MVFSVINLAVSCVFCVFMVDNQLYRRKYMLNEIFMTVPDHGVTGRCTYALSDLLTIALLTYICGGEDYVDMSEFAFYRARDFGLLDDCPDCSPSPDTFNGL